MSDRTIAIIRWVLLAAAVHSLLMGTLLWRLHRRMLQPWYAMNEALGRRIPIALDTEWLMRAWAVFMALLFVGLWWWLGTAAAAEVLRRALRQG